jgi:hypothetical protein
MSETPAFNIVHGYSQNHTAGDAWQESHGRPSKLIVKISLPDVSAVAEVDLAVEIDSLELSTSGSRKYCLAVPLPYAVGKDDSTAKFDATSGTMTVTMPVIPGGKKRQNAEVVATAPSQNRAARTFIRRSEMNDNTLQRDYHFLDGAIRQADAGVRSRKMWSQHYRPHPNGAPNHRNHTGLPKKIALVVKQATDRGIALTILSAGMQKRKRNSSYFNVKQEVLCWRVEWMFAIRADATARRPAHAEELAAGDVVTPPASGFGPQEPVSGPQEIVSIKFTIKSISWAPDNILGRPNRR